MKLHSAEEFKRFYEEHASKVRGVLFRLVGEQPLNDLTQETFMKAWEHRKKFRGQSEASTWLYRISYNCAVDYLRRNKKVEAIADSGLNENVETSHEETLSARQIVDLVLRSLDFEHRAVVILFYLEDLAVRDIAESLSVPEGTVKSRLNHSRTKMNEFLTKKGVKL